MTGPPSGVVGYFKAQYPRVKWNDEWLQACWNHLSTRFQLPWPQLKQKLESQLLLSHLADSTIAHDGLFPPVDENAPLHILFPNEKRGILVQILEVIDIGHSALHLRDIHRTKMEDKKFLAKEGRANRRILMELEPTNQDNGQTQQQQQQQDQDGQGNEAKSRGFPRAMLRLRVSDGFTEYVCIEKKRIPELSMETTPLGAKLMLHDVPSRSGILMLEPNNCKIVPDTWISDLNDKRDELLEAALTRRIDGVDENVRPPVQRQPQVQPPAQRQQAQRANGQPARPVASRQQTAQDSKPAITRQANPAPKLDAGVMEIDDFETFLDDDFDDDEVSMEPPKLKTNEKAGPEMQRVPAKRQRIAQESKPSATRQAKPVRKQDAGTMGMDEFENFLDEDFDEDEIFAEPPEPKVNGKARPRASVQRTAVEVHDDDDVSFIPPKPKNAPPPKMQATSTQSIKKEVIEILDSDEVMAALEEDSDSEYIDTGSHAESSYEASAKGKRR